MSAFSELDRAPITGASNLDDTVPPNCLPDLLGSVLSGRYAIEAVLGSGGMGTVYRARQLDLGPRAVAVKVLRGDVTDDRVRLRFEREAQVIARLCHPNTIRIFDVGRLPGDQPYFVMELLEGESLAEVLAKRRLSQRAVLRLAKQICGSLIEAHDLGVIHRDLKPANVFLQRVGHDEVVKVLDFGIAKLAGAHGVSLPGQVCGTLGFMSPEQLCGDPVGPPADVWALGAVLYEALSGRPVFVPKSVHDYVRALFYEEIVPLQRWASPHPRLVALVHAMITKDPEKRPGSMREVAARLAEVERALDAESERVTVPLYIPPHAVVASSDEITKPPKPTVQAQGS